MSVNTRHITVNTKPLVDIMSPIKSSDIMSPSTPLTPEELITLRVKLTKESQKISDALKFNKNTLITTSKMKKSSSSHLLAPQKSSLKKSDSMKSLDKRIKFNQEIVVGTTHHTEDYDRQTSPSVTAFHLTQETKIGIRQELNEFKMTMQVHEDSIKHTVFYK